MLWKDLRILILPLKRNFRNVCRNFNEVVLLTFCSFIVQLNHWCFWKEKSCGLQILIPSVLLLEWKKAHFHLTFNVWSNTMWDWLVCIQLEGSALGCDFDCVAQLSGIAYLVSSMNNWWSLLIGPHSTSINSGQQKIITLKPSGSLKQKEGKM